MPYASDDNDSGPMTNCRKCGKLCLRENAAGFCRDCSAKLNRGIAMITSAFDRQKANTTRELAKRTGLPIDEVRSSLRQLPALARFVDAKPVCTVCGRRPPVEGLELCLQCHLDTLYELRWAADTQQERTVQEEKEENPPRSVRQLLNEKRGRTGGIRVNTVTAQRLKPNRLI